MVGTITFRAVMIWLICVPILPGIAAGAGKADVSGEWVLSVTSPHGTEDQEFLPGKVGQLLQSSEKTLTVGILSYELSVPFNDTIHRTHSSGRFA